MTGGMADLLAAHGMIWQSGYVTGEPNYFTCDGCDWRSDEERDDYREQWAAHQAEVLSGAGFVDGRALLDDLRRFARDWDAHAARFTAPQDHRVREDWEHVAGVLHSLAARYAPSDPTPKEQQP